MGYERLGLRAMRLLAMTEMTRLHETCLSSLVSCLSSLHEGRIALRFLTKVYIDIQSGVNMHRFSSGGTFYLGYKQNRNLHAMYTLIQAQEGVKTSYF